MPPWVWSTVVMLAALAVFFFARHRASQPADPLNIRLIDYSFIALTALVAAIVALVVTLFFVTGHHVQTRLGALAPFSFLS